ncbi:MAG: HAD family hydrolase [Thomasclavelia sp.]|jgi:HAD superfamily hydrolase (TIGR01549 family)|nr:HAD family hydrolase [Thomasclavelia sp.]
MKYKAIIYDIDSTLLNTLDMNMYPLIQIIKEELNKDISLDDVLKYATYPGMQVMEELGIKNKEEVYARWVKYVNEYPDGAKAYPGIQEVLESLHGRVKQAIVTSKKQKQYDIDFVSKGLDKYIDEVVLEEDTSKHKPDPEPLNLCLKKLGLDKSEVIYIGDARSDKEASSNANIDFGLALWGTLDNSLKDECNIVLINPKDILKL